MSGLGCQGDCVMRTPPPVYFSMAQRKMARLSLRLAAAPILLWVALAPSAPEADAQSSIFVDFDRVVFHDRTEDLIYSDYNVQEGATLRPIIKFSAATPSAATFSVLAEAGTGPAEARDATADVDFPAGIHTFTVPAGSIRHKFEIPIYWDAEIEDYENFTLTLQTPPSGYELGDHKISTVQIVNVSLTPSDWTLNPGGLSTGDQYRLLFKTGNRRAGASNNINHYDDFVRSRTAGHPWHPDIEKYADTFRVLGSVHRWAPGSTTRRVDASWRTATGVSLLPQQPNLPGHTTFDTPIYWLNGMQIAPNHNEFWTGVWGDANAHANQRHADGKVATTTQGANTGTLEHPDNKLPEQQVAGTHYRDGGLGSDTVAYGHGGPANNRDNSAIDKNTHAKNNIAPYFGISAVFEVGDFQTADPVISFEGLRRVDEGGDATFTVTASAAPVADLTINLNVRESTVGGVNYVPNREEGDRTVVIRAGQQSVKLTIPTNARYAREDNGKVVARILPGAGYAVADHTDSQKRSWQATAIRNLNDGVQLNFATQRIAEFGTAPVKITVEVADGFAPWGSARTINYTVNGSAEHGEGKDYTIDGCTSSPCSISLPANTHSASILLNINNDGLDENDETIVFTLQPGSGYKVNTSRKTTKVTLTDDDTRGLTFHRRWADIREGSSDTITVRLSSQPTAAVTVKIASNNRDVTVSPSTLTFNPGGSDRWDRARTVTIAAAQDNDAVDDTAILTYTTSGGDYGGANALSIDRPVSVGDDDTATITPSQLPTITIDGGPAVTEGSAASFTVNADPAPTARLTVSVEVVEPPGQDFVAASHEGVRTITLNAGATSASFTVPTVNDSTDEADGFVQVFVNDGAGYSAGGGGYVDVNDNDDPTPAASFSSASSSVGEGDGSTDVHVNLTPPAPSGGLTIRYTVSGAARAGSSNDFTIQNSGTLSVAAGASSATIPVAINDDNATENAETVILTLTGGTGYTLGGTTVHTLTINDNDGPGPALPSASFASASSSAAESAGTRNVTVNLSSAAPAGGLAVGYSVTGTATAGSGNDFTIQNSGTLSVAPGATSATIPVAINDDSARESAETVILTLTGGTGYTPGSTTVHTLTITDNDNASQPAASFTSASSSAAESAGTRNVTVNLSSAAPAGGLAVGYSVTGTATAGSGNDFTIQNSGTLSVAAGASSATIPVAINDDSATENAETVILTLTSGTGYTLGSPAVHTLTIIGNDNPPAPAREGSFIGGGGITDDGPARDLTPSEADYEWTVDRDLDELGSGHALPTGMWSDGAALWLLHNASGAGDAVYAYDIESGERREDREFALAERNRAPRGIWSDGTTVWVSDSGQDKLFASVLATGGRLGDRDIELDERNADARGIWSDGETMWVLDGRKDSLFAYDLATGDFLAEYVLDSRNHDPRGLWSDGVSLWVSDHGLKQLWAYRLAVLPEGAAPPDEPPALERVRDEDFTHLSRASNNSPRGIWSDGALMYVADANDGRIYSYNMPDAIDARLTSLELNGVNFGEFDPRRTEYDGVAAEGVTTATVVAVAAQADATVVIEPADDDTTVEGHQVALTEVEQIAITVTSEDGSRERSYRVRLAELAEAGLSASCLRGAVNVGFSLVVYEGGSLDELVACAEGRHATALYVLVDGDWVSYHFGAPEFGNAPFRALFTDGVPAATPLTVSEGPAQQAEEAPEAVQEEETSEEAESAPATETAGDADDQSEQTEAVADAAPEPALEGKWVIAKTGGQGVSHRTACRDDARVSELGGWPDGTEVELIEEGTGSCADWVRVRADGITSWVRNLYVFSSTADSQSMVGSRWIIGNTGGEGVSYRDECVDDARVGATGGWPDGTVVTARAAGEGQCAGWLWVEAADGVTSWVREEYLVESLGPAFPRT